MQKKYFLLLFVFAFMMIVAACADDSNVEEETDGGEDGREETLGSGDLTVGMMNEIVTLDLHYSNDASSSQVRRNIYERLIFQDTDMELQPMLAEEWEQTEDTVWNFKLREDTTFHNGSDFTAEDVKATFDRASDPAVASAVAFLFEMIEEVEVIDDYEVAVHTEYPFAPLPSHLAHGTAGIMSKEIIDKDYQQALDDAGIDMTADEYYELREAGGDEFDDTAEQIAEHVGQVLSSETDGTNHLQLESRSAGDNVVLTKFEDFTDGERNFDTVTFRVIPESGARMAELEGGGIQVATDIDSSSAERLENTPDTALLERESVRMSYLGMNVQKAPFDDVKVRQAIAYALDRDEIISGVYDDMGIKADGPLAPDVWGYNEDLDSVQYDLDRAKELLSETEVADGFDTTIWVNDDQQIIDTAVYIQEALSELNINVSIEQYEWGSYLETLAEGEQDMYILGWTTVTGDADYGLYALFHSDSQGETGNRSFYDNSEVDELLDAGRTETDEDQRYQDYTDVQEILIEEVPMAYIFHVNFAIGVNDTQIEGAEVDPTGALDIRNVEFKQ